MHVCLRIVRRDTVLRVVENICQDSMLRTCETARASYVSVNYSRLLLQIYLKHSSRFFIRKSAIKIGLYHLQWFNGKGGHCKQHVTSKKRSLGDTMILTI